jgi:hypothetical protein
VALLYITKNRAKKVKETKLIIEKFGHNDSLYSHFVLIGNSLCRKLHNDIGKKVICFYVLNGSGIGLLCLYHDKNYHAIRENFDYSARKY